MKYLSKKKIYNLIFWLSFSGLLVFIFDYGFPHSLTIKNIINGYYVFLLVIGIISTVNRYLDKEYIFRKKVLIFDILSILFCTMILGVHIDNYVNINGTSFFYDDHWMKFAIILTFIRELFEKDLNFNRQIFNPAQLFILSFMGVIFIGTLLLLLPKATNGDLSFMDALFTSTSAVCVTGLSVFNVSSFLTTFGKIILLCLIQIGGLGILTFASFFSYFFKGGSSYETQLSLREMTSSKTISQVFSTLRKILFISFSIEIFSAFVIYFTLPKGLFDTIISKIFFSVFHSVSAFCNAGFSTLPNGLYQPEVRYNYGLHLIIIFTFFIGGLGFPIVENFLKYLKYRFLILIGKNNLEHRPWVLSINSRITLATTTTIFAIGFVLFFILEYNSTLAGHSFFGKIVEALFGAATPRTAGFNTVDMSALKLPTIFLIFLLMWIGASPSSTGGGIKTSTVAIAILNLLSLARGKSKIEVFRREIADISIQRSFAIIVLSLLVIGFGTMLVVTFDSEKGIIPIAFECFSAYSTVGLSLGITGDLSEFSKLVLICIMFIGRVSALTILIAMFKKIKEKNYAYPKEEITIN